MSFPPATEMVQFAGFASCSYGFTTGYRRSGGLPHSEISGSTGARPSPELFAACHVLHRLSVPRHSPDALLTKARPRPAPSARAARAWQRTDDRGQRTDPMPATGLVVCLRFPVTGSLQAEHKPSPRQGSRPGEGIPMPRPSQTERLGLLHGHDSLHDVREQMAESRGQTTRVRRATLCHNSRSACQKTTRPEASTPAVCLLPAEPGGPGPTRTADLTLIRRAL
jgi:hypothetical protein